MNSTIVEMDESGHQKIEKLLPWLLVDALTGDELVMMRTHLQNCQQCQESLEWQRRLQTVDLPTPAFPRPDMNRAFAALYRQLPRKQQFEMDQGWFSRLRKRLHIDGNAMRWALLAQFVAIAVLSIALLMSSGVRPGYPSTFRALGSAPSVQGTVVVLFQEGTTEQELRRIVRSVKARIIDGPTVTGAYVLNIPNTPNTQQFSGITALRQEPAVALVESLDAAGKK